MAYVYGLFDPRKPIENENCHYIGQTIQPLSQYLENHIQNARGGRTADCDVWIRSLLADGIYPVIHCLTSVDEILVVETECQWILRGFSLGWPLTNHGTGRVPVPWDGLSSLTLEKIAAFWAKVNILDDASCWVWTAYCNDDGYGMFGVGSRTDSSRRRLYAHRLSWELTNGPIPHRLIVCHACDNPSCVNPGHLFLDTFGGNMKDASKKGRIRNQYSDQELTHCPQGHPFDEENTFVNSRGTKVCKICNRYFARINQRKRNQRKRDGESSETTDAPIRRSSRSEYIAALDVTRTLEESPTPASHGNPKIIAAAKSGGDAFKRKYESDPEFAAAWRQANAAASNAGRQKMLKRRVRCDECGFISNPSGIGHHQTSLRHSGKTELEPLED